ncbi:hypothetical protein Bbelb_190450 [Branchiostoma belcheri]|nr:hypothetical protein Bbelb_190450 [Branchiostoma belcheri]
MATQNNFVQNIFLVLILVTASYLCGLMSALHLSREIDTAPKAWWEEPVPRVHLEKRQAVPGPVSDTSHGDQRDGRHDAPAVPPQAPVVEPPDKNSPPVDDEKAEDEKLVEDEKSQEDEKPVEDEKSGEDQKSGEDEKPEGDEKEENSDAENNEEKANSKESIQNEDAEAKDINEILQHAPPVKKQKKFGEKNTDLRNLDFNEEYRAKYFKSAKKIRTVMNRILHVTQDVVFFSGFDDDVDNCFMDGQFKQVKHYASCAVVGGSGILTGSKCGPEIDAHDFVIRFNLPHIWSYKVYLSLIRPVLEYGHVLLVGCNEEQSASMERVQKRALRIISCGGRRAVPNLPTLKERRESAAEDVGIKVNMTVLDNFALRTVDEKMVLEPDVLTEHFLQFNNSLLFYSKTIYEPKKGKHGLGSYERYKRVDSFLKKAKFNITLTYAMKDFKNITEKMLNMVFPGFESPTIGLLSYLMAITFCDEVDIYGFYPFLTDQNGNPVPFHYHGAPMPKEFSAGKAPHLYHSEYNLMTYMNSKDVIRVTVGKCQGLGKKTKLPPPPAQ